MSGRAVSRVTVVDYDRGNLFSVGRALAHCGAEVAITHAPDEVRAAERLVLPGVGAFGDAMEGLRRRALVQPILDFAASGRPFLGICVGMQLMFEAGEEFGEHAGLALIPGRVRALARRGACGRPRKVPHIGWSEIVPANGAGWDDTILANLAAPAYCYFVHSFTPEPRSEAHRLGDCSYGGERLAAAVRRDNLWGCQFHPEKSGETGLAILGNFLHRR